MFVDQVTIHCKAGDGGSGCLSFRREANVPRGGPNGGNGGRGGMICVVAARNVSRHAVGGRVNLIQSDLFHSLPACRYDLIVANPPYVPVESIDALPGEYRAEPVLGLVSGSDGLNATLTILVDAARFLSENGVLVCEVGESEERLLALLPELPFLWLDFSRGGSGVFILTRVELEQAHSLLAAVLEERKNVT